MSDHEVTVYQGQGQTVMRHPAASASFAEITQMANAIVKSGLYAFKSNDQAISLMLLCQAEGLHPAEAMRRYHIMGGGTVAMKADTMLAEFQARGGRVNWEEYGDDGVTGVFSHPAGGSVRITWNLERARQADVLKNGNYKKYPAGMFRARCISEGVRTVLPGVVLGVYTPEEVADFEPEQRPRERSRPVQATRRADEGGEPPPYVDAETEPAADSGPQTPKEWKRAVVRKLYDSTRRGEWFGVDDKPLADRMGRLAEIAPDITDEDTARKVFELAMLGWAEVKLRADAEAARAAEAQPEKKPAAKKAEKKQEAAATPDAAGAFNDWEA